MKSWCSLRTSTNEWMLARVRAGYVVALGVSVCDATSVGEAANALADSLKEAQLRVMAAAMDNVDVEVAVLILPRGCPGFVSHANPGPICLG
jgi:hypothetical protein